MPPNTPQAATAPATKTVAPIEDHPPSNQLDYGGLIMNLAANREFDVDKLQKLLQMRQDEELRIAERDYADAMARACGEMGPVAASMYNPQTRSKYAKLSGLLEEVRPIAGRHGIYVGFDLEPSPRDNEIVVCCIVRKGAYTARHRLPVPVDTQGLRGAALMTRTHAQLSAVTYGRRALIKMVFNLAESSDDDDGNRAGGFDTARVHTEGATHTYNKPTATPAEPPRNAAGELLPPHEIAPDGESWQEWSRRFVAAVNGAKTAGDIDAWTKHNNATLEEMRETADVMHNRVMAAIEKAKNKLQS